MALSETEKKQLEQLGDRLRVAHVAAQAFSTDLGKMRESLASLIAAMPDVPPLPQEPPGADGTWPSGVFTNHKVDQAQKFFGWLGRPVDKRAQVCAFVTHDKGWTEMLNPWWQLSVPKGAALSLRVPLVPKGDVGSLAADKTAEWQLIARQAAMVDESALICPGWEFNLPGWPHKITAANKNAWVAAFKRAYTAIKAVNPQLVVGLNPNGGDDGQTGVSVEWVYQQLAGYFDALGPDQYDCWPPMTSETNVTTQLTRKGGLNWHLAQAEKYNVPLIVPEWGVASGKQWQGNQGGDNPRYIQEMHKFFQRAATTGKGLHSEAYFNEPAAYVASAIFDGKGPSQNVKAAAEYHRLWSAK